MPDWLTSLRDLLPTDVLASIGVRELIIALVLLIVIYMLVVVLRMKSLGAQRRFDEIAAARYEADLTGHPEKKRGKRGAEPELSLSTPIPPGKPGKPGQRGLDDYYDPPTRIEPRNKYAEPPDAVDSRVSSFDQEKLTRLERDLSATREELDALRTAFAQNRDSMLAEIERLKATQRVSPTYGDSLQMAMSGASAEDIAARCGIARAEAELVLSLARGASAIDENAPGNPGNAGEAPGRGSDDGRSGRSRYGSY